LNYEGVSFIIEQLYLRLVIDQEVNVEDFVQAIKEQDAFKPIPRCHQQRVVGRQRSHSWDYGKHGSRHSTFGANPDIHEERISVIVEPTIGHQCNSSFGRFFTNDSLFGRCDSSFPQSSSKSSKLLSCDVEGAEI